MKLNNSLHCTVDGTDRSLAMQGRSRRETWLASRVEASCRDDPKDRPKDSNHAYGRRIVQLSTGVAG